jgi:hypothetical protein
VAAYPPGQSEKREHEVQALVLPGLHHLLSLPYPAHHRHRADVLLPAVPAPGIPGHEGPPVRRLHGALPAQHASLGGARHGGLRLPAHVPRVLHRLLQEAAPVQLGGRRCAAAAHAWASPSPAICCRGINWPSGRSRSAATSAATLPSSAASCANFFSAATALEKPRCSASMCCTSQCCRRLHPAHDRSLLARAQRRRPLSPRLEAEAEEDRKLGHHRRATRSRSHCKRQPRRRTKPTA